MESERDNQLQPSAENVEEIRRVSSEAARILQQEIARIPEKIRAFRALQNK